jgi:hypothetical protein
VRVRNVGQHNGRDGPRKRRKEQSWLVSMYQVDYLRNLSRPKGPRGTLKMLVDGAGQIKMTKVRDDSGL